MAAEDSMALILVEQLAAIALSLTREAIVIERGVIAHQGASAGLLGDTELLDRYIGVNVSANE
jgi:branched-chain amino acid transport system ATP-binding protein